MATEEQEEEEEEAGGEEWTGFRQDQLKGAGAGERGWRRASLSS